MKYAKTKDWFPYFYDALPEFNGMKMKSGTINHVKGFCGYHRSKDGTNSPTVTPRIPARAAQATSILAG